MGDLTVWKFAVPITDQPVVEMPGWPQILSVAATSPRELALWAVVDPDAEPVRHAFELRGTGHPLGRVGSHIATIQDPPFVWHLFEADPAAPPACGHWVEGQNGAVIHAAVFACRVCAEYHGGEAGRG
ncbi:hypothetical protein GXB85_04615 [Cellulomonas sp. APG4]|uniref:DUF7352 domain-containing protein n=1 Tax=Cellulomonas sp. APG4 TaxID=1538656 RepID=UPI00137B4BAC|nr:hypothetical protein [Cellulomonas sp. APG4]NCT90237.1 hypothetical protein [Cellulomonas sp. APG4]